MSKTPVGEVRPSQLLWTYGPGALIDLPNLSVVTMGIDRWEMGRCQPIQEARLLTNVRRVLGDQVESLRMPPLTDSDSVDPFSAEALIGVPVKPFPRWMRCVKCGLLSPLDAGLFELKANHPAMRSARPPRPASSMAARALSSIHCWRRAFEKIRHGCWRRDWAARRTFSSTVNLGKMLVRW